MTSASGVPVSACFSAKAICSSVYLDFFISSSLPTGSAGPENSRSNWAKKQGGRQVTDHATRLAPSLPASFARTKAEPENPPRVNPQ
jgi:hypothetical protein